MSRLDPIDVAAGDELFREAAGRKSVPYAELDALPDRGAGYIESLKKYIEAHPRLEVEFGRGTRLGEDYLIVTWRWRF